MENITATVEQENHVVWTLYDAFRTAALNVEYAERRLHALNRRNLCLEGAISATATGAGLSGIGTLLAKTDVSQIWQYVWFALSIFATVAAWLKPLLKVDQKIACFEKQKAGYIGLRYDLEQIAIEIREQQSYTEDHKKQFAAARLRQRELMTQDQAEVTAHATTLRLCEAAIRERYPPDLALFYTPNT